MDNLVSKLLQATVWIQTMQHLYKKAFLEPAQPQN